MLEALARRQPIDAAVALVVAHPDDETVGVGGSLHLFRRLLLIHVTDGAPRHLTDAAREGFSNPADYAAARAHELDTALSLSGATPIRLAFGVPDQEAVDHAEAIVARLRDAFRHHDIQHVLTHAFEGGHPDHDTVACAVHRAAEDVFEFAGYHASPDSALCTGAFLGSPGTGIDLPAADRDRKRAMIAAFVTQRDILGHFGVDQERFRRAPRYDFTQPPHEGRLLYEEWGWMTGADWRDRAATCAA